MGISQLDQSIATNDEKTDNVGWNQYRLPEDWTDHMEDFYFPINVHHVEDILGKMLTHVEAMNLPQGAEKANKDLVRQTIWKWFGDAQENSMTSYRNVIAPIELPKTPESIR